MAEWRVLPMLRGLREGAALLCVFAALGASARLGAAELLHEAVRGDTLWALCARYSERPGCWSELQRHNRIANQRRIPLGTVIRIPAAWLRDEHIVGGVLEASGAAEFKAIRAEAFAPLVVGEPVYLGDEIRTADGTAVLEFVSGLMILLRPGSVLLLDSFSDDIATPVVNLSLASGAMEAAVVETEQVVSGEADYSVATDAAVAGIAGAARVSALGEGAAMRGEAVQGTLEIVAAGAVLAVPEGFGTGVQQGRPPEAPRALLPPPAFLDGAEGTVQWAGSSVDRAGTLAALQSWLAQPRESGGSLPDSAERLRTALHPVGGAGAVAGSIGNSFAPVRLRWEVAAGARSWQLDVLPAGRSARLLASHASAEPAIALPGLAPGCYVVGLRAADADGFQGLESRHPLCVHPALAAPQALAAAEAAGRASLRLQWTPVEHAVRYVVEIAEDAAFGRIAERMESATPFVELPRSRAGGFARVHALNIAGLAGPASEPLALETCLRPAGIAVLGIGALGLLLLL